MSNYPLAVVTPLLGARSETFIRRHLMELMPKKTACLYGHRLEQTADEWGFSGPHLNLGKVAPEEENARFGHGMRQNLAFQFTGSSREKIHSFLLKNNVQVLLTQYLDRSLPWIKVARDLGLRLYTHAHGYDVSRLLQDRSWREEYLRLNDANGIIVVNSISRRRLIDIGINEDLLRIIPCGVNQPIIKHTKKNDKTIKCLAVGRMVGKKAPIYTLDAFRQALKSNPDLRLNYIGDGQLMAAVHQYIKVADLRDKVVLHGSKDSQFVHEMMQQADIFMHHAVVDPVTGDEEGLPVAILEAMQHRLPVISTQHAGIPDAVVNAVTGYLVEEGDTLGMSERICELANDRNLRERFGDAGSQRISDAFSFDCEKQQLLKFMELK